MSNFKHGLSETGTYHSWENMLARCSGRNEHVSRNYAHRGIKVCERWLEFENFLADMGERPEGMSIDRHPDVDGDYEPGNCRWATKKTQNRNRRNNRRVTLNGITRTVVEWAEVTGIPEKSIGRRLREGWSAEDALTVMPPTPRLIEHDGKSLSPTAWANHRGWEPGIVLHRLRRGWSEVDAVTIPPGTYVNQWRAGIEHSEAEAA